MVVGISNQYYNLLLKPYTYELTITKEIVSPLTTVRDHVFLQFSLFAFLFVALIIISLNY